MALTIDGNLRFIVACWHRAFAKQCGPTPQHTTDKQRSLTKLYRAAQALKNPRIPRR